MQKIPPITRYLIIANVAVFFICLLFPTVHYFLVKEGALYPVFYNEYGSLHFNLHFKLWQLVSYMFLHADFSHIFFNMFSLWMFGRIIEQTLGTKRFLAFYFISGIGAGLCQIIMQMFTENSPFAATIGASGACYGILLAFGLLYPNQKIYLLIPPIPIKAKYMVIVSAVIELLLGMSSQGDNVAHFAHLGGMLFGWFLIRYWRNEELRRRSGFTSWEEYRPEKESVINRWKQKVKDFSEQHQHDSSHEPEAPSPQDEARSRRERQEEINRILDKIKRSGYDSLTEEEKRKLFDAGNR